MTDTAAVRWLEGLVVLDLTRYLAGPVATRLLTELGATVIKIEQPPFGDPNRSNRPRINRRAGAHIQQNRGKQSVCVDLDTQEGQEIVRSIAAKCDIVVENFSPGVLNRKHLGYNDLKLVKPDIIMASISGFGQTGPLAERPCFDLIAQAYSGIMHMTGEPDGPPTFVHFPLSRAISPRCLNGTRYLHTDASGETLPLPLSGGIISWSPGVDCHALY